VRVVKKRRFFSKSLAAGLGALLVLLSPGPGCTLALARMRSAPAVRTNPLAIPGAVASGHLSSQLTLNPTLPQTLNTLPSLVSAPNILSAQATQGSLAAAAISQAAPQAAIAQTMKAGAAHPQTGARTSLKTAATPIKNLKKLSPERAASTLNGIFNGSRAVAHSQNTVDGSGNIVAPQQSQLQSFSDRTDRPEFAPEPVAAPTSRFEQVLQSPWLTTALGVVGGLALLLSGFGGLAPVAGLCGGVCVTFRTLEETEGGQLGFRDDEQRRQGMKELTRILRTFGTQVADAAQGEEFKTQVSSELVARTGQQAMANAMNHFLASVRDNPPANQEEAVARFEEIAEHFLVTALGQTGLSADDEATIRAIVAKTGIVGDIVGWQDKWDFVETLVARAKAGEKIEAAKPQAANAKKNRSQGGFTTLSLLFVLATTAVLALDSFATAGLAGTALLAMIGGLEGREQKPLAHRLGAWVSEEELEMLTTYTREVEPSGTPLVGRMRETEKILDSLSKPKGLSRSILLTGREGVGKRAVVESIASGIRDGRYAGLDDAVVLELDASRLIGQQTEQFALQLREALEKTRNRVILYIENADQLKDAHGEGDSYKFFQVLKPSMRNGAISIIAAAPDGQKSSLERDGEFSESLALAEPSEAEAFDMVEAHRDHLEALFGLSADADIIEAAVDLSARHLHEQAMPGSALQLLEKAFTSRTPQAAANRRTAKRLQLIDRLLHDIHRTQKLSKNGETAQARLDLIYNSIVDKVEALKTLKEEAAADKQAPLSVLDLARSIEDMTGIPSSRILKDEKQKLMTLEDDLKTRVIHQDPAIETVAAAVRRARTGLKDPNKPIGSFLFVGPTGVGKTELAKGIAELLFDDEANLIRLDMSEYKEPHSVARLAGTHPGYVGFEQGGQLTEQVRKRPYSVVLLDEIEKAHPEVLDLMLQVMDDGRLTDGHGNTVPFGNVILIMTSNLGSQHIMEGMESGRDEEAIQEDVLDAVKGHLRPEFYNRLDDTVQFNALNDEAAENVVELHLKNKVDSWLQSEGGSFTFPIARNVLKLLVKKGFDRLYGGRSLTRVVQKLLLDPLSHALLSRDEDAVEDRHTIGLDAEGERITFDIQEIPPQAVIRRQLADAETRELLDQLLVRDTPLTRGELEAWLVGSPEDAISREPLGIFHPMAPFSEGTLIDEKQAESDNPDLKDGEQARILADWPARMGLGDTAVEGFAKWFTKTLRCGKSTNCKRTEQEGAAVPDKRVRTRWVQTPTHNEIQIHALPLTRSELLETAKILSDHFAKDSTSADESWDLADELLDAGAYGRAELFEVKRHLMKIEGAEFGYVSDQGQLVFWLRMPRTEEASEEAAEEQPVPDAEYGTPADATQADESAADMFLYQTRDAHADLKPIRQITAQLLDSNTPAGVHWGFRAARGILGEENFAPVARFMPPIEYLPSDVARLYAKEFNALSARSDTTLFEQVFDGNTRLEAAEEVAEQGTLSNSEQQRILDELIKTPRRKHAKITWTRRVIQTIFGWGALALAAGHVIDWIWAVPFLTWFSGWWHLIPIAVLGILGLITIVPDAPIRDALLEKEQYALRDYGEKLELSLALLPTLDGPRRETLFRAWANYVNSAYYTMSRYSTTSDGNQKWLQKTVRALADNAEELPTNVRKRVSDDLLKMAQRKKGANRATSTAALLTGFPLFAPEQQLEVAQLAIDGHLFDEKTLERLEELLRADLLPHEVHEQLTQRLVSGLHTNRYSNDAALFKNLSLLTADLDPVKRRALADILWQSHGDEILGEPIEFLQLLWQLSPGERMARNLADELLQANPPHASEKLAWLKRQASEHFSAEQNERLQRYGATPLQDGEDSIADIVRNTHTPWEQRLQMLINYGISEHEQFVPLLIALYQERAAQS
jgi:ATP-dependent Clp protease ATP-binding subunit ClpC